jgi:tripartite-type tricarboxylate transporter receptor subunit TctC
MKTTCLACALLAAATAATLAEAQTFPSRPLRLSAPFPAGGGVDIVARLLAQKLTASLGQQVVVDNRPGATGIIGTQLAASAPDDGYTMLMGNAATHGINPSLFRKLPYDPVKDFDPVTLVGRVPEMLVVNPALPAHSVKELIALARAQPGKLTFGSAGNGSPPHMAGVLFTTMAKINLVHVPYKGSSPALNDLIGGQINLYFSNILSAVPHVRSGRLRALGVTGAKRSVVAPDVPTIAEAALPGYEAYNWYGLLVPKGTPPSIVRLLHERVVDALNDPDIRDRLTKSGAEVIGDTPQQFARFISSEIAKYAQVVKAAGLKAQ